MGTGQALAARKRWAWMRWLWNAQANLERKCSIAAACVVMLLMQGRARLVGGFVEGKTVDGFAADNVPHLHSFCTLDFFTVPKQVWHNCDQNQYL